MYADINHPSRIDAIAAGMPEHIFEWFALVCDGVAADMMELWDGNEVWSCRLFIDGRANVISVFKDAPRSTLSREDAQKTVEKLRAIIMAAAAGDVSKPSKPH